jgi:hypothetical protein
MLRSQQESRFTLNDVQACLAGRPNAQQPASHEMKEKEGVVVSDV